MHLTLEQIKSITQGAERIEQKGNNIAFYRFNEEEDNMYSHTEFSQKTFATALLNSLFYCTCNTFCKGLL